MLVQQGLTLPLQSQVPLVQWVQLYVSREEDIYNYIFLTLKNYLQ